MKWGTDFQFPYDSFDFKGWKKVLQQCQNDEKWRLWILMNRICVDVVNCHPQFNKEIFMQTGLPGPEKDFYIKYLYSFINLQFQGMQFFFLYVSSILNLFNVHIVKRVIIFQRRLSKQLPILIVLLSTSRRLLSRGKHVIKQKVLKP